MYGNMVLSKTEDVVLSLVQRGERIVVIATQGTTEMDIVTISKSYSTFTITPNDTSKVVVALKRPAVVAENE